MVTRKINLTITQRGRDASVSWTNAPNQTSFYVEVENPDTDYYNRWQIFNNHFDLRGLDAGKTYNIRIQAICNNNEENAADFTEWHTLSIPEPVPIETDCPECGCDAQFNESVITNYDLRNNLQPGNTIVSPDGSTRYILKTVEKQSDNIYRGIFVLWWEYYHVKILCEYWDLSVNTDDVIINFDFVSLYNPQFLLDADAAQEYIENLTETISQGLTNTEVNDTINVNNPIDDIYIDENGNVIVVTTQTGNSDGEDGSDGTLNGGGVSGNNESGGAGGGDGNGGETNTDQTSSEDKSIAMVDRDFLYTIIGDTLYNNHTRNLLMSQTPIPLILEINKERMRIHPPLNGRFSSNVLDSINYNLVEWIMLDNQGVSVHPKYTGSEYNINREKEGSYTLIIDAKEAIKIPYTDTITGQEHFFTHVNDSAFAEKCQMKLTINIQNTGVLKFKPINDNYHTQYGFDDALQAECQQSGDYGAPIQIAGTDYYVPTLYVQPNQEVELKLECEYVYTLLRDNPSLKIRLKGNSPYVLINNQEMVELDLLSTQNGTIQITDILTTSIDAYLFDINKPNDTVKIGRLAIVCQELNTPKQVRIISVRRSDESGFPYVDKQEIITNLNELYKQTFNQFELDNNYTDTLSIALDSTHIITTDYMRESTNYAYSTLTPYYIFVVAGEKANKNNGEGTLPRNNMPNISLVFVTDKDVVAHEIGHNLGLDHTFNTNITPEDGAAGNYRQILYNNTRVLIPQNTTHNIMDYIIKGQYPGHRRFFYKYQIIFLK